MLTNDIVSFEQPGPAIYTYTYETFDDNEFPTQIFKTEKSNLANIVLRQADQSEYACCQIKKLVIHNEKLFKRYIVNVYFVSTVIHCIKASLQSKHANISMAFRQKYIHHSVKI